MCFWGHRTCVQDGVDPAILGPHLIDGDDGDCDLVVAVALVSDYHFWAVVKSTFPGEPSAPWVRDKGELVAFQAKGVHPGLGSEVPKVAAAPGAVSHQARGPRPHMGQEDGDEEHRPEHILQQYDRQRQSMQSCTSAWHCHDGAHGQHPQMKQSRRSRVWQDEAACAEAPARCLARRKAMTAMAYGSVHYQSVPEAMRYQRGARRYLMNPREWQQGCKNRDATRKYITTCSRLVGAVALASQTEGWACAHGRQCIGCDASL
jgi:hypothetical protein